MTDSEAKAYNARYALEALRDRLEERNLDAAGEIVGRLIGWNAAREAVDSQLRAEHDVLTRKLADLNAQIVKASDMATMSDQALESWRKLAVSRGEEINIAVERCQERDRKIAELEADIDRLTFDPGPTMTIAEHADRIALAAIATPLDTAISEHLESIRIAGRALELDRYRAIRLADALTLEGKKSEDMIAHLGAKIAELKGRLETYNANPPIKVSITADDRTGPAIAAAERRLADLTERADLFGVTSDKAQDVETIIRYEREATAAKAEIEQLRFELTMTEHNWRTAERELAETLEPYRQQTETLAGDLKRWRETAEAMIFRADLVDVGIRRIAFMVPTEQDAGMLSEESWRTIARSLRVALAELARVSDRE